MKTRPGMIDDAARARAVMPTWPPFTARDRSGHLTAGRHRQARVPARQSARRTLIHGIVGRAERSGASAPPGLPGTRCALDAILSRAAHRVTGRDARGPNLPPGRRHSHRYQHARPALSSTARADERSGRRSGSRGPSPTEHQPSM
jgi:hypothetical protein